MRILVVDNEKVTTSALVVLLSADGHQAEAAANGVEALTHLDARRPDVLVLDYLMPAMDGLELLRQLRQDERFQDLPVILTTAAADPDLQPLLDELPALQPLRVLRKPFDLEELRRLIDEVRR